jgi:hypothetical protein
MERNNKILRWNKSMKYGVFGDIGHKEEAKVPDHSRKIRVQFTPEDIFDVI